MCGCWYTTHWTSGHPRHVFEARSEVSGGCLPTSSVGPRVECILTLFLAEKHIYSNFREKPFAACQVHKMAESHDCSSSLEPNSSSRDTLTFIVAVKAIIGANYFVWTMDWRFVRENLHVWENLHVGFRRIGMRMTRPWSWSRFHCTSCSWGWTLGPSVKTGTMGRPDRRTTRQGRTMQPPHPSDPMITARLCHLVCQRWIRLWRSDGFPGLEGLITIVDTVMIIVTKIIRIIQTSWVA